MVLGSVIALTDARTLLLVHFPLFRFHGAEIRAEVHLVLSEYCLVLVVPIAVLVLLWSLAP